MVQQRGSIFGQAVNTYPVEHRECHVTAILVLFGLPRLLTGSILAHECMHAYLKLTQSPKLTPAVEEGLCQLMAYLWIERQQLSVRFTKLRKRMKSRFRIHLKSVSQVSLRVKFGRTLHRFTEMVFEWH